MSSYARGWPYFTSKKITSKEFAHFPQATFFKINTPSSPLGIGRGAVAQSVERPSMVLGLGASTLEICLRS